MYRFFVSALAASAFCLTGGCSADTAKPAQTASAKGTGGHTDSAAGLVVAPTTPYTPGRGGPAALAITVGRDSVAPPRVDGACEIAANPEPVASDAMVWVDGIRQGKPLPEERRYALVSSGCALSPRIQGVVVGGAINVYNDDRVLHRLVFIRAGTNDTLQTMPFTNDNEVVATDRLTRVAGIVEVRCAQHPQERAYIGVFDQPYFAVGPAGATLTLDSVPPGDYSVMTWREGMATPTSTPTRVGAIGQTQVTLK